MKPRFYAEAGIREVWIVDLNTARLLVYRGPRGTEYDQAFVVEYDGAVTPLAFPDLSVAVADLIP